MQSQVKTQVLVPGSNLVSPKASSGTHGQCSGVWTLRVNLLEGTRVPVYLVVVGADVGDDPRHSYQNDNVDLRERREREAVRGKVHPQDTGTCPATATPPPTGNTAGTDSRQFSVLSAGQIPPKPVPEASWQEA